MRKVLSGMLGLVMLGSATASAGTLTVTIITTTDQELALTVAAQAQAEAVTRRNAEAAAWNTANPKQPPRLLTPILTRDQWLADQVSVVLIQLSAQHRTKVLGAAQATFEAAAPSQKVAICTALGLSGKLAECP